MPDKVVTKLASLPRPVTFKEAAKAVQRVAAYARVSTDHEEQETSLAAQTDYYKRKIMEHPGWEFVQIYVDNGISGLSTSRRDGFNHMIEDCLAGRIDLVLTKSISRFARNTVDKLLHIDPRLQEHIDTIYYDRSGYIRSSFSSGTDNFDDDLNQILNLNSRQLLNNRVNAWKTLMQRMDKKKDKTWTADFIHKYIEKLSSADDRTAYSGFLVYLLI